MIRSSLRFAAVILVVSLVQLSVVAQSTAPAQIKIVSFWTGLGKPAYEELIITRKDKTYYTRDQIVDAQLVSNLIDALNAPAISRIDLPNLGIDQAWLDANAEKGVKEYTADYYSTSAPNLQALYLSTFKNLSFMKTLVASLYPGRWTDDYPRIDIEIKNDDGTRLFATSDERQLFMVPWEVTQNGRKVEDL